MEEAWPETFALTAGELPADPEAVRAMVLAAGRRSQRLVVSGPLRLGAAALRLLSEAATHLVEIDWTLAGEPPWPVRTTVHLPPPGGGADTAARKYAALWREQHRYGLCTYRRGPGFVRIRDIRPGGPHLRILVDGPWAETFDALLTEAADPVGDRRRQLLGELTGAGLTVALGDNRHILPVRLRRWPIPYTDV
jgi:hypothetical protein